MTLPVDDRQGGGKAVLERFLADIVVDDYARVPLQPVATVTGQPDEGARRPRTPMIVMALLVAAVIGLIIAGALVNTRLTSAERQQTRSALIDRISTVTETVAARQVLVDERSTRVQAQQDALLAASQDGPGTVDAIARLSNVAAAAEASGPGITVTIDDAPNAEEGSLNRVLDRDLQDIVNQLWRSGATGIAVNNKRLTGTSAIRGAGEAILVNYQPVTRPYVVTALGAVDEAQEGSGLQALLAQLTEDYGLVTDARTGDVALPVGEVRAPRFASTAPEAVPDATATIEPGGDSMIAIIGLLVGIAVGVVWHPDVPIWLEPYLPIAIVAALDAVFGGFRALMEKRFDDRIFVVSFLSNVVIAAFLVFLGDQLGVGAQMSIGVVVVLAMRIFANAAAIRRILFRA